MEYLISLRCFFRGNERYTQHHQRLALADIPRWIEAYRFTHPHCEAITVKVWLDEGKGEEPCE